MAEANPSSSSSLETDDPDDDDDDAEEEATDDADPAPVPDDDGDGAGTGVARKDARVDGFGENSHGSSQLPLELVSPSSSEDAYHKHNSTR